MLYTPLNTMKCTLLSIILSSCFLDGIDYIRCVLKYLPFNNLIHFFSLGMQLSVISLNIQSSFFPMSWISQSTKLTSKQALVEEIYTSNWRICNVSDVTDI
jgi:hypothetical protein